MGKSIIIIGAGMGGMACGVYGQVNGYDTRIFEAHNLPGGQCAGWKRKGYTFDACIHHLFGCSPGSGIYSLWNELGAMPIELTYTKECVSALSPDGKLFVDYYDPERLEHHLKEISPQDSKVIDDYIKGIRVFSKGDIFGDLMFGGAMDKLKMLPTLVPAIKWFKPSMQQFADKFSDPFLKRAFPLLEYSAPDLPFMLHLVKHASGYRKDIAWPVGGSLQFAGSIEKHYRDLGGEIHYRARVERILTDAGKAVGVMLEDGSEFRADTVISNADGRKTILDMLEGRYADERIRGYCGEPDDETNWAVHVFLGVDRDLSQEPSAQIMLLDEPVEIANHVADSLEMQTYGMDRTMAPEGKGVIKVELVSGYEYWKKLHEDGDLYEEEKRKTAETVIDILEGRFSGIRRQVEVVDVPTLMTWERFMGGTHGFVNMPKKKMSFWGGLFGKGVATLPGLSNFYMAGTWATSAGALFMNALSGRNVIKTICSGDGREFRSRS
jgi:phytoene dehydrogenase-like protein